MKRHCLVLASLAGLLAAAGCGPGVSKVEGVVQYEDGTPVDNATVVCMPQGGKGASASGLTDARGKFTLKTGSADGAQNGTYKVLVTKVSAEQGDRTDPNSKDAIAAMKKLSAKGPAAKAKAKSLLPEEYGRADRTPLTLEVPASGAVTLTVKKKK